MPDPLKIVIVGGVAAGPKAAARARRLAPDAEITIIEKDMLLSYAGCGLPYYISGMVDDRNDLMATPMGVMRDPEFFASVKGINVLNQTEATQIDREAKELEVKSLTTGETKRLPYDQLILATGAEPANPPIEGRDLENVLQLKRVEDADVFRRHMQEDACPNVAIVGGGLIGMEMTEAVTECGRTVTVIEMLPQILPMLDSDIARLVEKHMRDLGVHVITSTGVARIEGDGEGKVQAVVLTDGQRINVQLVLMSVGIRPNVSLAREAGLTIGPSGGVLVDEYMRTTDQDIFAAGDCAEKVCFVRGTHCFLPLGSVANKEGRVAGSNAVGHADRFPGVSGATALKVFDYNVGRVGLTVRQAHELGMEVETAVVAAPDRPHYYPGAKPVILKIIAEKRSRKLLGLQGVGTGEIVKRIDVAVTAMTAGMTVDEVANLDLAYAPPYSEAMDILIQAANTIRNKMDGLFAGVNSEQLQKLLESDEASMILDVRTPDEHEAGHIQGSTLIPLGKIRNRFAEIPRKGRVIVYCKSSLRAYVAVRFLAGQGYENVEILDGGFLAWPFEASRSG